MTSLALVMIARDEARCIERCLRSVAGLVDRDVGVGHRLGGRHAGACAALRRARCASWPWRDDFAAARNAALALTDADWRLVLDADEWIGSRAPTSLQDVAAGRHTAHRGCCACPAWSMRGAAGVQQAPSWMPRLLPCGVMYRGRVHEQPVSPLPRQRLPLQVLHDGYLPEQMARKGDRNRRLLNRSLQLEGADPYLLYQLGKDHEVHGRFAQAAPCYGEALSGVDMGALWRHDLVLRQLFTLKKLGRFEQAMALASAEMPHWGESPDFYFTLGDLLLDWAVAQPQRSPELLPMIESSWRRALAIGDNPALPDTVLGRGSFLAAHNLAVLFEGLGDAAQARAWREQAVQLRAAAAGTPTLTVG
jgi:hypothetical protein